MNGENENQLNSLLHPCNNTASNLHCRLKNTADAKTK